MDTTEPLISTGDFKLNKFFVSCPLNFEKELIKEIESFWFLLIDLDGLPTREPLPEFEVDDGGIEFRTPLHLGLQINFFTKLALRVLLRVESFEARYFDQFEKGLVKLGLEKYFSPQKINIQIESMKSRLFHEGNLLESATRVLGARNYIYDKEADLTLLFRVVKDRVMVSLDTSGEHLHFRGYRKHQGEAPIRENLASLILQLSALNTVENQMIFDPYCGSGTFFFEAQICGFPNFNRGYSFQKFKNTPALFKSESWKKNYRWINSVQRNQFFGLEKNSDTFKKIALNNQIFNAVFCPVQIEALQVDSEKYDLHQIEKQAEGKKISLITNPPYGERSAAGEVVKNIERFESLKNLSKIVVIHPENWTFRFKKLKLSQAVPFSNQGLKTQVSVFEV